MYEPKTQKGLFGNIALWTIGLVVLVSGISIAVWGFGVGTADVSGRGNAHKQLRSANYRIPAYDHFYDLCGSVQANEDALAAQEDELKTATDDDRSRVAANISGLKAQIARSIRQYNADARKTDTLGHFRASDLPYQLDSTTEGTSCEI